MCAFSARAARDELIKWWINLKKNGGKRSKIRKNINDERKSPRERVKAQTFCCVVCCVHFLGEKRNFLAGRGLCFVSCSFLLLFLVLVLFQGSHVQLGLVCVYILEERSWCSRSLFLLGLGRFSLYRDTRSLWRSLNTRGGCFRERKSKSTNSKARRFRASI